MALKIFTTCESTGSNLSLNAMAAVVPQAEEYTYHLKTPNDQVEQGHGFVIL